MGNNDGYIWCRVHTHASLPTYIAPNERDPGDVVSDAWIDKNNTDRDKQIAGRMAGDISNGQASGGWAYLRELKRMENGD
jgi:hypothetical protein